MTVTPRGIWTPDDSDDYDFTVDMAATAVSIDNIVSKLPVATASGQVSLSVTASAGGTVAVSFPPGRFSKPPLVFVTRQSGGAAKYIPYTQSSTLSGAVLGIYSGDGTAGTQTAQLGWLAVGE